MMNKKGQTLLEVMLAIGIMTFGIISIISLSITSSVMARRTSKELIATQLAREGIEVVHNKRDSNWLAIEDGVALAKWYDNIYNVSDSTAVPVFNPVVPGGGWSIIFSPTVATKICLNPDKVYIQKINNNPCLTGYLETPYRRLLTFTQILDGADFVGLKVKSEVIWDDGGNSYSKILEENIYDWKAR